MNSTKVIVWGLLIPFLGTTLGASFVFLMKQNMKPWIEKVLLGFASGVMIAASVFSLILPSIDMAEAQNVISWVPASVGFLAGVVFLLGLDQLIPHLHLKAEHPEGHKANLHKTTMLVLAVTLHNIPEGMAVGVTLAGFLSGNAGITAAAALALSLGIAIQNVPEGAVISMPLKAEGGGKLRSFTYGMLSGIVEPLGGLLMIWLTSLFTPILPYILSFAAGAMIYVVVEELIPDAQSGENTDIATIGVAVGFVIMMILDVALG